MRHSIFLRRSLAMLLLLATLLSLLPNVFAAEEESDIPKELRGKDLVAELDENGDLVYSEAGADVKAAMRAASFNEQATQAFSTNQRVAFFLDNGNSEGNTSYKSFTYSDANIDNLTARGVTDFFVMTKTKAGSFSVTNLKNVITYAGTAANVYAWMHCALDNKYIKANEGSAQYHFRVGRKCNAYDSTSDYYDTRNGYVDLRLSAYKTYFNGLVDQVEACTGVDGVLLDSVKFGADYYGWCTNARTKMGTTAYNAAVVKLAAHHGYTYKTNSSGYYVYKGTTTADYSSLTTYVNANSANAQTYYNYRSDVIKGFVQSVRDNLGSSLYLGVAIESDWDNSLYTQSIYGQFPENLKTVVSNGFCVVKTFMYTMGNYGSYNTYPINMAKAVAKLGCNVFVGMDGYYPIAENQTATWYHVLYYQSYNIYNARYTINGDLSYGGDILGAALYTAGNVGLMRITVSSITTTPSLKVEFVNPNIATYGMLGYFNKYNDTDAVVSGSGSVASSSGSMQYYKNANGYIVAYDSYTNGTVAAFGTGHFTVPVKNVSVGYTNLPFARIGLYDSDNSDESFNWYDIVPHYALWRVGNHTSCTFTETVKVAADCVSEGYSVMKCACGYDYIKTTPITDHKYVEQSRVAATCEAAGSVSYKCSVCSATKTETLAALGHNYVATVTPPSCISQGYTTYVCANDASHTYIDNYTAMIEHNFVNGVCSHCGFTLATLIHFKLNSEENTWDWQLIGGSGLGFDTSTDGTMYGTTDGMTQAYFYVDPADYSNLNYTINDGDVIQIRMRVKTAQSTATTATPSVSLGLASGADYGATLSGDTLDLTTTEWQIITIPVTGYTADETAERIRINMFGDELVAANVEIDYIHFGTADATPITVTFYSYKGKVLQRSMIAPGTSVTYYGETPTKPRSAGFEYTFSGWIATGTDGTTSALITDLSTVAFSVDTALTPQFTSEFKDPEPINSNKRLVDNDDDLEDYKYDIEIDAATYGEKVTINKEYKTPMDIVIVMDRSTSTVFSAVYEDDYKITSASDLTAKLKNLVTTMPEGYYSATNWLGIDYVGAEDVQAGGYISYEDMRYHNGQWEVWQTLSTTEAKTLFGSSTSPGEYYLSGSDWTGLCRPGGVVYYAAGFAHHYEDFGRWVPITQAYNDFIARRNESFSDEWESTHGLSGYTASNIYFRIGVSRRAKMQKSLNDFVEEIYSTLDQLPKGSYHTISVIGYGYGTYVEGQTSSDGSYSIDEDLGVSCSSLKLTNSESAASENTTNLEKIYSCINHNLAFGSTYTDDALTYASDAISKLNSSDRNAASLLILFTDGAPTHGATYEEPVANTAINAVKTIKENGTDVFVLGFMKGLNSAYGYGEMADNGYVDEANNFLHLVSSNYKSASSTTDTGSGSNAGYYFSTNDGSELGTHLAKVYITTDTKTEVQTSITADVEIHDIVTREWNILKDSNGNWDVKVQRCNYTGGGGFSDPIDIDNTNDSVYTLTVTELTDENGNLTGETEVVVDWHGVPDAWLRDDELVGDDGYMGYKLLITIGIELDRESTIGGNNIPTNTPESGVYYPENPDLNHTYAVPNVNVEMVYDHQLHDYFLDLHNDDAPFDLIDVLAATDQKDYKLDVFENLYTRTVDVDGLNNRFVNIAHYAGNGVYSESLTSGATEWTETFVEPTFDFKKDQSGIPVRYEVTPITSEVDSLGREPFSVKKSLQTASANYYAPKYMVVDYFTTVTIPMYNEIPSKLNISLDARGAFDTSNANVKYTFRNDADNGSEMPHILRGIEEIGYTVTAINTPKRATSNTVDRTIHIIPANTVEYDFELLKPYEYVVGSGHTGTWDHPGDIDRTKQNHDNAENHGYDSALQTSGQNNNYSFGRTYVTTVSDNVRDSDGNITEYHNNNALKFSFTGTGFDVISQTGPDEGIMIVEVYNEGTTTLVKRFMVDNYLANKTLYQIPVVHCMGLTYGSYDVVIRGYYNAAFSHYVAPETAAVNAAERSSANVMTEAKIRELLGLSEDDLLEYSLSTDRAKSSRALTESSYDIHVDGVRIYNTLSDSITADSNAIANYAYNLANERNAQFENVHSIMLDSKTWTYGDLLSKGLLYVATGRDTNSTTNDTGMHLSSNGVYNYKVVDGVKYLVDSDDKYITHPEYNSNVYVETGTTNGAFTCKYYCDKTEGETVTKIELSATDVGKLIGQTKIVFYNSDYTVNSPKNEVYLSDLNGVAFNAKDATMLQISAKSIDGAAVVLQVYDWTAGDFIDVPGFTATSNSTEMYYNIHSFVDSEGKTHSLIAANGDVVLRNYTDGNTYTGVISICNIKVIGATITPPANASKSVDLILTPPETSACEHPELTHGEAHAPTCVAEGNIEFWYCDDCECYFTDAEATVQIAGDQTVIDPTGEHDYANGVCSVCGDKEFGSAEVLPDENLKTTTAITVGAQMKVAYTILAADVAVYESFYLEVSKEVANAEPIVTIFEIYELDAMIDPNSGEVMMYRAIYCGVNAKEMGDSFTATLYAIAADGTVYCGGASTMTIRDYLLAKADNAASSAELKTMAIDMLNYGAAAQLYFDYNTDRLANADLTEEQAAYATKLAPEIEAANAITGDGVDISTGVVLGNEVTLNLSSVYESESTDLLYLIKDAKTGVIVAELKPETKSGIFHKAAFADVSAKNMRKELTIELYDGDTLISKTLTWSIEGYAAELIAKENTTLVLRDLLNAMLTYGDSVADYMSTISK